MRMVCLQGKIFRRDNVRLWSRFRKPSFAMRHSFAAARLPISRAKAYDSRLSGVLARRRATHEAQP
jgi:hypothetical protein